MNNFWEHNKKWLVFLGAFVGLVIIITSVMRVLTPPIAILPTPQIITTNKDGTISQITNVKYSGQNPNFPTELHVVKASKNKDLEIYVTDQLIKNYSLKENTNSPGYWNGSNYSMSYSKTENKYSLSRNYSPEEIRGSLTQETSIQTAQNIINKNFPGLELVPLPTKVLFIQNLIEGKHNPSISYSQAQLVVIPFTYMIDGFPVFYGNQDSFPFIVAINKQYEIQKIEFNNFFIDLELGNKLPIIPLETALININNNQASIIYAVDNSYEDFSKENITSGTLTSASLEYRLDENIGIAYPFYRFEGTTTNSNGTVLDAEIITPAVVVN